MIRFEPQYKPAVWGNRRFAEELGRSVPDGPLGESWELVELGETHSRVARGPHEGKTLGELWSEGALGGSAKGPFPFLLKWLDSDARLSVQVHPDEAACARLGEGLPKTEAWLVAHTELGAVLLIGHYPGLDPATLRQASTSGTIHKWLYESRPRVGDMILLPAGTLHAVGAGFLLLEIQQPSDTTYRLYDWGRMDANGKPRELHLEQACQSVNYGAAGPPRVRRDEVVGPSFVMRSLRLGSVLSPDSLRVLVAATGPVKLASDAGETVLQFGDVVVAEPADGPVRIATGACVLVSEPT